MFLGATNRVWVRSGVVLLAGLLAATATLAPRTSGHRLELPSSATGPGWEVVLPQVRPAVVRINAVGHGALLGSGVYIGDGYILTAEHVIRGLPQVAVTADLGALQGIATVVGWSVVKDIAVLRVAPAWSLPPLHFQATSIAEIGQEVVLLGYPLFDDDSPSLSRGIISRYLSRADGVVLETDAASNPGVSGGPLVNRGGRIVGILQSAPVGREEGLARARVAEEVVALLPALKDGRRP